MQGIQKRNLLVGPCAVEKRDRGPERLEIEENERVPQPVEELPDLLGVGVIALAQEIFHLHPLPGVQGNERHVVKL